MGKQKRKLTKVEKAEKKRRREKYMTIFVNGKQKRVERPILIDGIPEDEFIRINADPIWLLQNGMYEELHEWEMEENARHQQQHPHPPKTVPKSPIREDDELPF